MNKIERLENKLKYIFKNKQLLKQALTHRSAGYENNERLEFLGDSILNFVIAKYLYHKYPNVNEGVLTRMRSTLVQENALAEVAKMFNLGEYLILGSGELKSGGFNRSSILSDAVEAIICAIYIDTEFNILKLEELIGIWFKDLINDTEPNKLQKDPKTRLQEYLQSRKKDLPTYKVIDIKGKDHNQEFVVSCQVISIPEIIIGNGSSIRKAEQNAAEQVLTKLGKK